MSVKRTPDRAGIDPDAVHVDLNEADGDAEMKAIMEILEAGDAAPRIEALRKFPELASRVAWLDRHLAGQGEDAELYKRLGEAEFLAYKLAARPKLERDTKRQAGTKKSRSAHKPKLDEWLAKQDLSKTPRQLFNALPMSSDDDELPFLDGGMVNELDDFGRLKKPLDFEGFRRHVYAARKKQN